MKFCGVAMTYNHFVFQHGFLNDTEIVYYKPYHAIHILVPESPKGDIQIFHRRLEPWTLEAMISRNST